MSKYIRMAGVGSYLPGEPISFNKINEYLGNFEDAPKKIQSWANRVQPMMKEMLGINYCYYAFDNKTRTFTDDNLTMSVEASKKAIESANLKSEDIDLIVYGGAYSSQIPPMSTKIQEALGIDLCGEFYIHSNCTSIYKAIKLAHSLLSSGEYKNALVVSSNVASSSFIPEFYNQEVITKDDIFLRWYLCDGAGAMVLKAEEEQVTGFYLEDSYIESAGGKKVSAMFNKMPYHWLNLEEVYKKGLQHISQIYLNDMKEFAVDENGKTIFYNALNRMIEKCNIDYSQLGNFVINMPSKFVREYIIDECVELGIERDKFYSAIENVGYSGPPAAIISIDNLLKERSFKDGDLIFSFVMEVSKFMQAGFTLRYNS